MSRPYDEADDLEEQDNYYKDNNLDHENFVARQYAQIVESVPEAQEPEICCRGAHYVGSPCSGDVGI